MHSNGCSTNYRSKYNELLEREKKAVKWIDAPERTEAEINKHLPNYEKILADINHMIFSYGITGNTILQGFKYIND